MRRSISGLLVVVLTGALLITSAAVSSAASKYVSFSSKSVKVPGTGGYKLELGGSSTYVYMYLTKHASHVTQKHSYNFFTKNLDLSSDLSKGAVTAKDMGSFGKLDLEFHATEPMTEKTTCDGKYITRKRAGVLTGVLKFKPDTQGNAFFNTIKIDKFHTTMIRTVDKGCQSPNGGGEGESSCPSGVALFMGDLSARKSVSGTVQVSIDQFEETEPATSISHRITGNTDDSSKMTYSNDLQTADADFAVATPAMEGMVDFMATEAAMEFQNGTCKGGRTWFTDGDPGNVTGSVTGHFDSYGDVTVTPTTGFLQRWTTN